MSGRVDFFIVGAPKCGTTSLAETLNKHTNIYIPSVKEPHFFCDDWPHFQRYSSFQSYISIFEDGKINGDASVWYLYSKNAPNNIYKHNSSAKIIICLRDPCSMIPSLHNQLVYSFREPEADFKKAWNRSPEDISRIDGKKCLVNSHLNYKDVGKYYQYIKIWVSMFGEDNVEIVFMDDLKKDPGKVIDQLLNHIGAKKENLAFEKRNTARQHRFPQVSGFLLKPPFPFDYVKSFVRIFFKDKGRSHLRNFYSVLSKRRKTIEIDSETKREMQNWFHDDWMMVKKEFK